MVTVAEVVNRFSAMANARTGVDIDGAYGMQCVDLPNALAQWYFGKRMPGNGIDMLNAGRNNGWAVLPMSQCAPGDIFVTREAHPYGHTGLIISRNGNSLRTIEQNYGTGGGGGPCVYVNRNVGASNFVGVTRPPYSDAGRSNGGGGNGGGEGFPIRQITNGGYTLSVENQQKIFKYCAERNILPSGAISQLYLESWWGNSPVGRNDNNWSGMTGTAQKRPSGVTVTTGMARPANEGGFYMHYANLDDFFNDWTYLITTQLYRVAGRGNINDYTLGLFRAGGAVYDYAAAGYAHYAPLMSRIRNEINGGNGGYLDAADQAFKEGKLVNGVGAGDSGPADMYLQFTFNIKGDPNWNAGTLYFYNGQINEIQPIHNLEELKYLRAIYQDCTGRPLKEHMWENNVPVYIRVFGVLQPGSQNDKIKSALDKIIKELEGAVT